MVPAHLMHAPLRERVVWRASVPGESCLPNLPHAPLSCSAGLWRGPPAVHVDVSCPCRRASGRMGPSLGSPCAVPGPQFLPQPSPQTCGVLASRTHEGSGGTGLRRLVRATPAQACPSHHWPRGRPGRTGGPSSSAQEARRRECHAASPCCPGAPLLADGSSLRERASVPSKPS